MEPQALAERARIILAAASGLNNKAIAAKVGVCAATAGTWRNRFAANRVDGLYDEPRPGAPREIGDDEIASTIRKTLETLPKGATHWSLRTMAREIGHARTLGKPVADQLGLVRAVVVHDDVDIEIGGHIALDLVVRPKTGRKRPVLVSRFQGQREATHRGAIEAQIMYVIDVICVAVDIFMC